MACYSLTFHTCLYVHQHVCTCSNVNVFSFYNSECSANSAEALIEQLPDSSLTSSSQWSTNVAPTQSRLHSTAAWAPGSGNSPWIQADLGQEKIILKIATQGRPSDNPWNIVQFTTSYMIAYSADDNDVFEFLLNSDESQRILAANIDMDTVVENCIVGGFEARKVRLHPLKSFGGQLVRWELYGINP